MYEDKVIVIAGGTGGVGEGIARRFASKGAQVVIPTRNLKKKMLHKHILHQMVSM